MKSRSALCSLLSALALVACAADKPAPPKAPDAGAMPMTGGDRDAHGCIGSAGYLWCGQTQRCERPWELAAQRGFPNTEPAFKAFCAQAPGAAPAR